jgi:hypothetical protein
VIDTGVLSRREILALLLAIWSVPGILLAATPRLIEREVIRIANEWVTRMGSTLSNFEPPQTAYDKNDDVWIVLYQGKQYSRGNYFMIVIHDKTGKSYLIPGE